MIEIILFAIVLSYCVYLNLRLKNIDNEYSELMNVVLEDMQDDIGRICRLETQIKNLQKPKKIEKSRRRSTKRSRKVSKVEVPKSKILRKSRGDKNILQTGGKG